MELVLLELVLKRMASLSFGPRVRWITSCVRDDGLLIDEDVGRDGFVNVVA